MLKHLFAICPFIALAFVAPKIQAAPGPEGMAAKVIAQTQALVRAYKTCGDVDPAKACPALDRQFDFEALTKAPIAGHVNRLSAVQKKRFYAAFGRTIRAAARRSGHDLTVGEPEIRFVSHEKDRAKADVHIVRPEDDVDAHVTFVFRTVGGVPAQIIDVELDGASMVQDYHNQFGRVLSKEGAEALVKKIESRSGVAAKKDL